MHQIFVTCENMSRRSKALEKSSSSDDDSTRVVVIAPEYNLAQDGNHDNQPTFCKLRHPKSGQPAMYLFSHENQNLLEVVVFEEGCRSWFFGDTVQKDGRLFLTSSVDPVFLILPYLASAQKSGKFMQLENILEDNDFPETKRLSACSLEDLPLVSDFKDVGGSEVYRYNKDKTLSWLRLKLDRVVQALRQHSVDVSAGAILATFQRSSKTQIDDSDDDYLRYASGLIADYLSPELAKDFYDYVGISVEVSKVADESSTDPPAAKKSKLDIPSPTEDYSQPNLQTNKKAEKLTASQKKLSKVDKSGMKSLSSFFGAKTAKK